MAAVLAALHLNREGVVNLHNSLQARSAWLKNVYFSISRRLAISDSTG